MTTTITNDERELYLAELAEIREEHAAIGTRFERLAADARRAEGTDEDPAVLERAVAVLKEASAAVDTRLARLEALVQLPDTSKTPSGPRLRSGATWRLGVDVDAPVVEVGQGVNALS